MQNAHLCNTKHDLNFTVKGIQLSAKIWPSANKQAKNCLAIHGWLDNAASFDVLAPLLENFNVVAIDLAGHGLSGHRCDGVFYSDSQYLADIAAIVEQLQWQQFCLLGHSMGAGLALEYAGLFADQVSQLVVLDAIGAPGYSAAKSLANNRRAISQFNRFQNKPSPVYPSYQALLKARMNSVASISETNAKGLLIRGAKQLNDGWTWRHDNRLRFPTPQRLSEDYWQRVCEQVSAPLLVVMAKQGWQWPTGLVERRLAYFKQVDMHEVEGGHHFHMETAASALAELINSHCFKTQ